MTLDNIEYLKYTCDICDIETLIDKKLKYPRLWKHIRLLIHKMNNQDMYREQSDKKYDVCSKKCYNELLEELKGAY